MFLKVVNRIKKNVSNVFMFLMREIYRFFEDLGTEQDMLIFQNKVLWLSKRNMLVES